MLYNNSRPLGMGFLRHTPGDFTEADGTNALANGDDHGFGDGYVDYLNGRVIKTRFGESTLNPRLYDRDNGDGAAERALNSWRKSHGTKLAIV
jgi:hypothetical protein